jgi:hypothetical protein
MERRFLLAPTILLVALALFAGCLQPDAAVQTPAKGLGYSYYDSLDFPLDLDHNHADPTLHAAKFQMEFVTHHACTQDGKPKAGGIGGFTDIAFHDHYAFVGKGDGFCILDVTDPSNPKFISQYVGESSADLEITQDGGYVLLLTQRNVPGPNTPAARGSTDPTADLPRGAIIVNVKDVKNPKFESYYPVPTNGVHTAVTFQMGDRQLVSIQTYDWSTPVPVGPVPQQNLPGTQRVEITELKPNAAGKMALSLVSRFTVDRPATDPLARWFPHDAYIQKHPKTGQTLLYIAYWDAGLVIVDISIPASPKLLSRYNELAPSKYNSYHDVKVSDELIAGRHITVTGPELESAAGEVGYFRIFDTTDPTKPVQLGAWTVPGLKGFSGGFLYSPHVFQIVDGHLFIAHNHAGLWVVDIHNETLLKHPRTAGYYFPHGDERTPGAWDRNAPSSIWGAYWKDGVVYTTERSGVHVLRWAGDNATLEPAESTAEPPE